MFQRLFCRLWDTFMNENEQIEQTEEISFEDLGLNQQVLDAIEKTAGITEHRD